MSNYLINLVATSLGLEEVIQPRLASTFERPLAGAFPLDMEMGSSAEHLRQASFAPSLTDEPNVGIPTSTELLSPRPPVQSLGHSLDAPDEKAVTSELDDSADIERPILPRPAKYSIDAFQAQMEKQIGARQSDTLAQPLAPNRKSTAAINPVENEDSWPRNAREQVPAPLEKGPAKSAAEIRRSPRAIGDGAPLTSYVISDNDANPEAVHRITGAPVIPDEAPRPNGSGPAEPSHTAALRPLVRAPVMGQPAARQTLTAIDPVPGNHSPAIRITIGRIDVRAIMPRSSAPVEVRARVRPVSLDDYLKQRERGTR